MLVLIGAALALMLTLLFSGVAPEPVGADEAIPATTIPGEPQPEPETPTIRARGATDLVDGQILEINGKGFAGNHGMLLFQCSANPGDLTDCDPGTDANPEGHSRNGRWTASMRMQRIIDAPSGTVDCAEQACVVGLMTLPDGQLLDTAKLSFDPAVEAPTRPEASVRPRRDIADGQQVEVKVSGLRPFDRVSLAQCTAGGPFGGLCGSFANFQAEVDGSGTGSITVRRTAQSHTGELTDCIEEKCFIFVRSSGRGPAPMVLRFDPDAAPPAQPSINLSKRRGLVDGDLVTVEIVPAEGAEDTPFFFGVLQCGVNEDGVVNRNECRYIGEGGHGFGHDAPAEDDAEEEAVEVAQPDPPPTDPPPATEPPAEPPTTEQPPSEPPTTEPPAPPAPPATDVPPPLPPGEPQPIEVRLRREIRTGHGENVTVVDCAESAGRCVIAVELEDGVLARSKPLVFDPDVPVAKANVVVTKANKFVAGGTHRVKIDNYLGQWVEVRQCPRDATSHEDPRCRILGEQYRPPSEISLDRFVVPIRPVRNVGAGEVIDCFERNSCDLRVFGEDGPMRRVLINFDADAQSKEVKMKVTPRKKLADAQTVELRVPNFSRGSDFWLAQCVADTGECLDLNAEIKVWNRARYVADITVQRFVGSTDCAERRGACVVQHWSEAGRQIVPLRFAKGEPVKVDVKVSPRKDLIDGQTVVVTMTPEALVGNLEIRQCVAGDDESAAQCVVRVRGVSGEGSFDARVKLRRVVRGVDCAERVGRCEVQVTSGDHVRGSKALGFDPDAELPTPVEFAMEVTPNTDLADGQAVEVQVSGSSGWYNISQCAVIDGEFNIGSCVQVENVRRSPNGVQTKQVIVSRDLMPLGARTSWDCATAEDACVLAVMGGHGSGSAPLLSVELTFDPDAERISPEVSVTPRTGLVAGQRVTVSGSDWLPGLPIFVVPCVGAVDELSIEACDIENLTPATIGADGTFSVEVIVSDTFAGQDCRVAECRLGVGDPSLRQTAATERLMFS